MEQVGRIDGNLALVSLRLFLVALLLCIAPTTASTQSYNGLYFSMGELGAVEIRDQEVVLLLGNPVESEERLIRLRPDRVVRYPDRLEVEDFAGEPGVGCPSTMNYLDCGAQKAVFYSNGKYTRHYSLFEPNARPPYFVVIEKDEVYFLYRSQWGVKSRLLQIKHSQVYADGYGYSYLSVYPDSSFTVELDTRLINWGFESANLIKRSGGYSTRLEFIEIPDISLAEEAPGLQIVQEISGRINAVSLGCKFGIGFAKVPVAAADLPIAIAGEGDADMDGCVDVADLLALVNAFGLSGDWADGDFDGDGAVDVVDLITIVNRFGQCDR